MKAEPLTVVVTAERLEEAVDKALAQLHCTRAEADIEVLQTPSAGVLGLFGKRPARVRARLYDRGAIARQLMICLLDLSGLEAETALSHTRGAIGLQLTTEEPQRLIGRHGQTLDALQTLVGTMTDRFTTDRTPVQLDVDGYRERRMAFLLRLARRLSRKVRQSGMPVTTPPFNRNERRILHEIFKREPGLESRSRPHDGDRKVIVLQKRG